MKKFLSILCILGTLTLFTGCHNEESDISSSTITTMDKNTVYDVLNNFTKALQDKDYAAAKKYYLDDCTMDTFIDDVNTSALGQAIENDELVSFTITNSDTHQTTVAFIYEKTRHYIFVVNSDYKISFRRIY